VIPSGCPVKGGRSPVAGVPRRRRRFTFRDTCRPQRP
jgi:hypothetical protein